MSFGLWYTKALADLYLTWENVPELDLRGRVGRTDYIDFLDAADLQHPRQKFVDRYQRPGLALLVVSKAHSEHKVVMALFQRYTGAELPWTIGWGHSDSSIEMALNDYQREHKLPPAITSSGRVNTEVLTQLLNGSHPMFFIPSE